MSMSFVFLWSLTIEVLLYFDFEEFIVNITFVVVAFFYIVILLSSSSSVNILMLSSQSLEYKCTDFYKIVPQGLYHTNQAGTDFGSM